jgi:hypothetical protein
MEEAVMNKVCYDNEPRIITWTVGELTKDNYTDERSAFMGRCGNGDKDALYLVTYDAIVLASNPYQVWQSGGCECYVTSFVDVMIGIQERTTR